MRTRVRLMLTAAAIAGILAIPTLVRAQSLFDDDATRYLAMGDSIAAGYKALPATSGYTYQLYQDGVFDRLNHTLFCNMAVPGATSQDVLLHQVPQALIPYANGGFNPKYITLTVGGNDLLAILRYASVVPDQNAVLQYAQQVLGQYAQNLGGTLAQLHAALPNAKIFVSNQYAIPEIEQLVPFAGLVVDSFNSVLTQVVAPFASQVFIVDAHQAFLNRNGLLLIERHGASATEVHLTNAGQRELEKAFAAVIGQHP